MMHLGWAFLQLSLLAPQALAETSVPLLRGSTRGLAELPSCTEKPNFHLARSFRGVESRKSPWPAPRTRRVLIPSGTAIYRPMLGAPWAGAPVLGPQGLLPERCPAIGRIRTPRVKPPALSLGTCMSSHWPVASILSWMSCCECSQRSRPSQRCGTRRVPSWIYSTKGPATFGLLPQEGPPSSSMMQTSYSGHTWEH